MNKEGVLESEGGIMPGDDAGSSHREQKGGGTLESAGESMDGVSGQVPQPPIKRPGSYITKEHMEYLGHFASDGVLEEGHNTVAHPGFKAVAAKIAAREGYSKERASAILAAKSRGASAAAKKANPRLKRVKG